MILIGCLGYRADGPSQLDLVRARRLRHTARPLGIHQAQHASVGIEIRRDGITFRCTGSYHDNDSIRGDEDDDDCHLNGHGRHMGAVLMTVWADTPRAGRVVSDLRERWSTAASDNQAVPALKPSQP